MGSTPDPNALFRIRFHGRGGQGMKTASRVLGTAFFREGFEVQDAPRYGAERRGAPIFAYVRAARKAINERGIIRLPDLVVVADETLVPLPAAGVLQGADGHTALLVHSCVPARAWQDRIDFSGALFILPAAEMVQDHSEQRFISVRCAGAAAGLVGVISAESLEWAIRDELAGMAAGIVEKNVARGMEAYELTAPHAGAVVPGPIPAAAESPRPRWIDLPFEPPPLAAPTIRAPLTSEKVKTGLWRTVRPSVDLSLCTRCRLCSILCPDGAITLDDQGYPHIDYDHCKGCLICAAQCPVHAIETVAETATETVKPQGGSK